VAIKVENITSNLYMLLGDTLQEADASVTAASQEETTMMWHRRLGHMLECG